MNAKHFTVTITLGDVIGFNGLDIREDIFSILEGLDQFDPVKVVVTQNSKPCSWPGCGLDKGHYGDCKP